MRADDGQGGQADWTLTVYSIEVTGFEVQERAWSESSWDAPEDSGADWNVLWKHDNHRWRPIVAPAAANDRIVGQLWTDGANNGFATADWCVAPYGSIYSQWDKWSY